MRITAIFLIFILSSLSSYSQNYNIKGAITDTLDNPLIMATVLLLEKTDSTMVDYTRSEMDGSFKFKNVEKGNYLVKTTYVGFIPLTVNSPIENKDLDLGKLEMSEIATELMEIVVKEAKAAIKMRGDTIEYDASTFQVPQGSTVEDLLRRLPGIDLDQDGSITSDGETVSKVTVDGKSFFGSDPKAATKNLPAEGISKVQVFDTKTEEEEVTGLSSSSTDKTMNLELKEGFKKGGFGKVVAGVGTASTAEAKGNYNRFNEKLQFSVVGVGNNTGRNGLSWNDYRDFMGSQSFNFGDGLDFGFGGGGRYYSFGGGGGGIESSVQSIFFSGSNNGGFPESYNGGFNLNYNTEKTKITSVYYYNQVGVERTGFSEQQKFLTDQTIFQNSNNRADDLSKGHRMEFSVEQKLDSLHTIKFELNGALINQNDTAIDSVIIFEDAFTRSQTAFENTMNRDGYLANSSLLFRKKFKKKGRRFGANVSYLLTQLDDDIDQNSDSEFYNDSNQIDSLSIIKQENTNKADKKQFKANAVYIEPISKKYFVQTFYNFSDRLETGDRFVEDINGSIKEINQGLTRDYRNNITQNRVGAALKYSHDGINISIGAAYQHFDLFSQFSIGTEQLIDSELDRQFTNWIPHFSAEISPVRTFRLSAGFDRNVTEPAIDDLQPIIDNRNPLYIREGNSALIPEIANNLSFSLSKSWPLPAIRARLSSSYSFYENQFSTQEEVDPKTFGSRVQPINIDGGDQSRFTASLSFPIIKNKITVRSWTSYTRNKRVSFVNNLENNTRTNSLSPSVTINITPNPNYAIYLNADLTTTQTKYDINTSQNQDILNQDYSIEFNAKTVFDIFLNSSFTYQHYTNKTFDFSEGVPILNVSLYRQFFDKKLETRISLYDGFNKNIAISQNAYGNVVVKSRTDALARYFMFSLAYNIRGMKDGVQKDGWW